jgi:phospholipase/carboxylesterase
MPGQVNRRSFLATASGGLAALVAACHDANAPDFREPGARLYNRRKSPIQSVDTGVTQLELRDAYTARNGVLYVPASYNASNPAPLVVALHGAGGSGASWTSAGWLSLLDEFGAVMIAPDSRAFGTWDLLEAGEYGPDVEFIDDALAEVFRKVNVNASRVVVAGFSDGASEALGLGLLNGDLFNGVVGFSPGMVYAPFFRGNTRAFVSHGTNDKVLGFWRSRDIVVPAIQELGVPVQFTSFDGGHDVPIAIGREGLKYAFRIA